MVPLAGGGERSPWAGTVSGPKIDWVFGAGAVIPDGRVTGSASDGSAWAITVGYVAISWGLVKETTASQGFSVWSSKAVPWESFRFSPFAVAKL